MVVTPPAPAVTVKQPEQPSPVNTTVKATEVDVTPATTSITVPKTSEDVVPSNDPIDTDTSNDVIVI